MAKLLTREMTDVQRDKLVKSESYRIAVIARRAVAEALKAEGYKTGRIYTSGNLDCAWCVDAERADGHYLNIEMTGGPWEGALDR
jgi:hypothetical protein